jgi:predicted transcriptional regulator of viral defense system
MQFIEFKNLFEQYNFFSKVEIEKRIPSFNNMNLIHWQKNKYLTKIRNGWYCFSDTAINDEKRYAIANKIYQPSYISMESALSYYGFIPEAVFKIISVSTLKTNEINSPLGVFLYHKIKTDFFWGYHIKTLANSTYKIAEPEKAILDFLYFNPSINTVDDIAAFRFNKTEILQYVNFDTLTQYAAEFHSNVVIKRVGLLKKYIDA